MARRILASILSGIAAAACAASPGSPSQDIEVRPAGGDPVTGTEFLCSEHAPAIKTPCETYHAQRSIIVLRTTANHAVEIRLSRNADAIQVDGEGVTAVLGLLFGIEGEVFATAREDTIPGEAPQRVRYPIDGWIAPVAASRTLDGRNAGRFSLTFDWGTIGGSYDSDDACVDGACPGR